jgi:hypothetical protein
MMTKPDEPHSVLPWLDEERTAAEARDKWAGALEYLAKQASAKP